MSGPRHGLPRWLYLIGTLLCGLLALFCLLVVSELVPPGTDPRMTHPGQVPWVILGLLGLAGVIYFGGKWEHR